MHGSEIVLQKKSWEILMSISAIAANDPLVKVSPLAKQYKTTLGGQPLNSVFGRDSLSLGNVPSLYQTYAKPVVIAKNENWSISDHYAVPYSEVPQKLLELTQEINSADLSGVSRGEKYNWVKDKFIEAFGDDFKIAYDLKIKDPVQDPYNGTGWYWQIGSSFNNIVHRWFDSYESMQEVNRARLYGDMSIDEVRDSIRAKYPEKLSNRDLVLMMTEMYEVGAACSAAPTLIDWYISESTFEFDMNGKVVLASVDNSLEKWAAILDNTADLSMLNGFYNIAELSLSGLKMGYDTRDFLVNVFGAHVNEKGLLEPSFFVLVYPDWKKDPNFVAPDLEGMFLKALEKHDISLRSDRRESRVDDSDANILRGSHEEDSSEPTWVRRDHIPSGSIVIFGLM